jgi:hypothetical protein
MNILLLHGYSETSLGAYSKIPELLTNAGHGVVVLSAFNSLDDAVSINDLAAALEDRVAALENGDDLPSWKTSQSALICHSTGTLIARRWLLNRYLSGQRELPSHFIAVAGANHGSTLAQVGKSVLGYAEKLLRNHVLSVGARVLTDIDYGSDFLLKLNREWLDAWNQGLPDKTLVFSMCGDSIGNDPVMKLFWGTCEAGSDNTVRISSANLNYRTLEADASAPDGALKILEPAVPVPYLVLPGYSHFGNETGILGKAKDAADPAFRALLAAVATTQTSYRALASDWDARTAAWTTANADSNANSTVVFSILDRGDRPIDDCMIAFWDVAELQGDLTPDDARRDALVSAMISSSYALVDATRSPIHNDVQPGSYSFYMHTGRWVAKNHIVHIEAHSPSPLIAYRDVNYAAFPTVDQMVRPNEFTYIRVLLERDTDNAYALYRWSPDLVLDQMRWMPFPPGSLNIRPAAAVTPRTPPAAPAPALLVSGKRDTSDKSH